MKISILVPGRLHGFDMALYFQKIGVLNELVTGYPKKYVVPFGIEKQFVKSLYINEIINRTTNWLGIGYPLDFLACETFDYLASKLIKFDSDVYFIWSGYGLKTIKQIRRKNSKAKIIIVRGSAHIEEQEKLLKKINESEKPQINFKIVTKELKEYDACDYITVPSTYAYNSFICRNFSSEKIFTNILGVDLQEFPFWKKGIKQQSINVGYTGTLSSRKNVEGLINVITRLNQNYPNRYKLIIAGPIDYQSFNEKLLEEHQFIEYKGKLPQTELHHIYKQIDVFVLNSIEEGFGMVLLQAMSCGCPIISTQNTGGPDVVIDGKNGIIIPAMDNDALENALTWFYKNKNKISKMGKQSRDISEKGFTWDDFGKRNIIFLNNICNK